MNEFHDLEESLRTLPLKQPDASLDKRVLAASRQPRPLLRLAAIAAIAAALAIAAMPLWLNNGDAGDAGDGGSGAGSGGSDMIQTNSGIQAESGIASSTITPTSPDEINVVDHESQVVSFEGMVEQEDSPPLLVYRVQMVRTLQRQDLAQGITIYETVPSEHLAFVPAQMQ